MKTLFATIGIAGLILLVLGGGQCSVNITSIPILEKKYV